MSEKFEPHFEVEKPLVPYEESQKIAKQLFEKYHNQLGEQIWSVNMPENGLPDEKVDQFDHDATSRFLEEIPEETREKFYGHGMVKGSKEELLAGFLNIIENKSIKGGVGPLYDSHPGSIIPAYKHALFLILSHFNKPLSLEEKSNRKQEPKRNKIGWVADVGAFVVNYDFYPLVEELKNLYPKENIIKANELVDFINKEVKEKQEK